MYLWISRTLQWTFIDKLSRVIALSWVYRIHSQCLQILLFDLEWNNNRKLRMSGGGGEVYWHFFSQFQPYHLNWSPRLGDIILVLPPRNLWKSFFPISTLDKKSDMISAVAHVAFKGTLGTLTTELVEFIIITWSNFSFCPRETNIYWQFKKQNNSPENKP